MYNELNECVLLEDLKIRGLIPIDRHTEDPNYHLVRLFLLVVTKYHAISLAIKDQQPEKFQSLTANANVFMIYRDNESLRAYFNKQVQYALNLLSAEEDAHLLKKLTQFFSEDALDSFVDLLDQGAMEPAAVISYGDANRYQHISEGKDCQVVLESYLEFNEHLRKYARQAIFLGFMALPASTSEPDYCYFDESTEGVTGNEESSTSSVGYNSKFNERMRDVVKDIVKLGYI
ncbi:hypothetical protein HA402_007231 [Bradysia odoriphaga]|nr:hypothetical protein HA402_007231 [Bradysia odoriphaga]